MSLVDINDVDDDEIIIGQDYKINRGEHSHNISEIPK